MTMSGVGRSATVDGSRAFQRPEQGAKTPLYVVSVGARRDETIVLADPFAARPAA